MKAANEVQADRQAQGDFIAEVVMSIIGQAVEQGVAPTFAASVVVGVGAKALRMALGPDTAAEVLRMMASEVEADRERFDA